MNRRQILRGIGTIASSSVILAGSGSGRACSPTSASIAKTSDDWNLETETNCESENYSLNISTLTHQPSQDRISELTDDGTNISLRSFVAIHLVPETNLEPGKKSRDECEGNVGVTIAGSGLTLPCQIVESVGRGYFGSDEYNRVSPEATSALDTGFRSAINDIHGFEDQYDRRRHLRDPGFLDWKELEYEKTGYKTFQFTYDPSLGNRDEDGLWNDLEFTAYLSVETDGDSYLGVGGVFPAESTQRLSNTEDSFETIEFDVDSYEQEVVEFMKETKIP